MNPNSAAFERQNINRVQQNGANLQNQFNQQAGTATAQYGQDVNNSNAQRQQANSAYGNLLNYTNNLPSYRNMYQNYFNQSTSALGYNAKTTQNAANNLTAGENIMSSLPQAANQAGNYSGATAGQVSQDYQNMSNSINRMVTNANNAMKNQLGMYNAAQGYATGASNTAINGETAKIGGYNDLLTGANATYQNAVNQQNIASQQMNNIEKLQANQGYLTAEQTTAYQNARSNYLQSQAALQQAAAATTKANAYANLTNLQAQGQQNALNLAKRATMKQRTTGGGYNFLAPSTQGANIPISAATYARDNNIPLTQVLQTMAATGDQGAISALRQMHGENAQQIAGNSALTPFIWGNNAQSLSGILGNTSGYSIPSSTGSTTTTSSSSPWWSPVKQSMASTPMFGLTGL